MGTARVRSVTSHAVAWQPLGGRVLASISALAAGVAVVVLRWARSGRRRLSTSHLTPQTSPLHHVPPGVPEFGEEFGGFEPRLLIPVPTDQCHCGCPRASD